MQNNMLNNLQNQMTKPIPLKAEKNTEKLKRKLKKFSVGYNQDIQMLLNGVRVSSLVKPTGPFILML